MEWDNIVISAVQRLSGGSDAADITLGFHTDDRKGMTILRCIGRISIRALSVGQEVRATMGLVVLGDEEFSALAIPEPETDTDINWLWWHSLITMRAVEQEDYTHLDFDVKSKRAFRQASDLLALIVENQSGFTFRYQVGMRVLYALP